VLTKITACVGVGIYSLKLHFGDGTQSPILGSRTELSTELVIGEEQVNSVGVRAWKENYVQTVTVQTAGKKATALES